MAPTKTKKPSAKASGPKSSSSFLKKKGSSGPKPTATQHKPKPSTLSSKSKKKPPHLRYTEKELKIPKLNGIMPAGIQKPVKAKKGKTFVDDKESLNAIMAMVMAEKEGNIESRLMRARQMEEVREAKRLEAEKRAKSKKEGLEERKNEIKGEKKRRRKSESDAAAKKTDEEDSVHDKKARRKKVSFG